MVNLLNYLLLSSRLITEYRYLTRQPPLLKTTWINNNIPKIYDEYKAYTEFEKYKIFKVFPFYTSVIEPSDVPMFDGGGMDLAKHLPIGALNKIGPVELKCDLEDLSVTFSATKKDSIILLYVVECIFVQLRLVRYSHFRRFSTTKPWNTNLELKLFDKEPNSTAAPVIPFLSNVTLDRVPQATLNGKLYNPLLQTNEIGTLKLQNKVNRVKLKIDFIDLNYLQCVIFADSGDFWYGKG